jgi:hypothetical protein
VTQSRRIGSRRAINRADFDGGQQGDVLRVDPNMPQGLRWAPPQMRDMVDLPSIHPGILAPSHSSRDWVSMGQAFDPIQYDAATAGAWSNHPTASFAWPRYRVDALGMIHFEGVIQKTTASTQFLGSKIFTMTAGLRPKGHVNKSQIYGCIAQDNAANYIPGNVVVWGDGSFDPGSIRYLGPHHTSISTLSLAGVSYLVGA